MGALSKTLRQAEGGRLLFWCPGCDGPHQIGVGQGPGPRWGWNGNTERPTFTPSILVSGERWEPSAADPDVAEKIRRGALTQTKVTTVCHSFVTDGRIQFLGDCTHALAGQTVDIPEWGVT